MEQDAATSPLTQRQSFRYALVMIEKREYSYRRILDPS
jgi:hypothetical protein